MPRISGPLPLYKDNGEATFFIIISTKLNPIDP